MEVRDVMSDEVIEFLRKFGHEEKHVSVDHGFSTNPLSHYITVLEQRLEKIYTGISLDFDRKTRRFCINDIQAKTESSVH